MTTGRITLYFDDEVITVRMFRSKDERKRIINGLNELYQFARQKKIIYYEITSKE